MKKLIAAFFLFFATSAFAFTDQEKVELLKIIDAGINLSKAEEQIGFAAVALPGNKAEIIRALDRVFFAQFATRESLSNALESQRNLSGTREEQVTRMFNQARSADTYIRQAITQLQALPVQSNVTTAINRLSAIKIAQMDQSLGYLDFRPASFPQVVGPHGDFDISQERLEHAQQYIQQCMWDAINFWLNTTHPANNDIKEFFRHNAKAQEFMWRAWGMDGDIILHDDHAIIEADTAAGSGLRPFGFFRVLLEVEYLFSVVPATNFAGRPVKIGAPVSVRAFADAFSRMVMMVALLSSNDLAHQFTGRQGAIGQDGTNGWAAEFYHDMSDFWRSMDGVGAGWMLFYHTIPAPPR